MKYRHHVTALLVLPLMVFFVACRGKEPHKTDRTTQTSDDARHKANCDAARMILIEIVKTKIEMMRSGNRLLGEEGGFDYRSYKALYDDGIGKLRALYRNLLKFDDLTKADLATFEKETDTLGAEFDKLLEEERKLKRGIAKDYAYGSTEDAFRHFGIGESNEIMRKVFK